MERKTPDSIIKEANKEIYKHFGKDGYVGVSSILTLVDGPKIKRLAQANDMTAQALAAGQEPAARGKFTNAEIRIRTLMHAMYELGRLAYQGDIAIQNKGQDFDWSLELGNTIDTFDPVKVDTRGLSLNLSKEMIRPLAEVQEFMNAEPDARAKSNENASSANVSETSGKMSLKQQAMQLAQQIYKGMGGGEAPMHVFVSLGVDPRDPRVRMAPIAGVHLSPNEAVDPATPKIETEAEINQSMLLLLLACADDLANFGGEGQVQIPQVAREDFTLVLSVSLTNERTMDAESYTGFLSYKTPEREMTIQ